MRHFSLMTNQSFSNDPYAHIASVIQNPPHFLVPWNRFTKPSPFLTSAGAQRALSIKVQLELFFITVFSKIDIFVEKLSGLMIYDDIVLKIPVGLT